MYIIYLWVVIVESVYDYIKVVKGNTIIPVKTAKKIYDNVILIEFKSIGCHCNVEMFNIKSPMIDEKPLAIIYDEDIVVGYVSINNPLKLIFSNSYIDFIENTSIYSARKNFYRKMKETIKFLITVDGVREAVERIVEIKLSPLVGNVTVKTEDKKKELTGWELKKIVRQTVRKELKRYASTIAKLSTSAEKNAECVIEREILADRLMRAENKIAMLKREIRKLKKEKKEDKNRTNEKNILVEFEL